MKFGDDAGAGETLAAEAAATHNPVHDTTRPDSPAAGIASVDRGIGTSEPGAPPIPVRGDTLADQIDALHADMIGGTALGNHTDLWNLVHAFKERVKALVASDAA